MLKRFPRHLFPLTLILLLFATNAFCLQKYRPTLILKGHTKDIYALAISKKGDLAVTASRDKNLRVWSLPRGNLLKTLKGHKARVTTVDISPSGKYALSGSQDTTVKLWDIKKGVCLKTFKGHKGYAYKLAITPDGGHFVLGSEKKLEFYQFPSGKLLKKFPGKTDQVLAMAVTPKRPFLLTGHLDKKVRIWRIPECTQVGRVKGLKSAVLALDVSKDGEYRLIGLKEFTKHQKKYPSLKLWLVKEKSLSTYKGFSGRAQAVRISPNNKYVLAANGLGKNIGVFALKSGKPLAVLTGHKAKVHCLDITPDGAYALSGDANGGLLLWKMPGGKARTASTAPAKRPQSKPITAMPQGASLKLADFIIENPQGWQRGAPKEEAEAGCLLLHYLPKGENSRVLAGFFTKSQSFADKAARQNMEKGFLSKIKQATSQKVGSGFIKLAGQKVFAIRHNQGQDTLTYVFPYQNNKLYKILFLVPGKNKKFPQKVKLLLQNLKFKNQL